MGINFKSHFLFCFYKQEQGDHILKFSTQTFADAVTLLEEDHTLGPQLQPLHQHPHHDDGQHKGHRKLHLPALQHKDNGHHSPPGGGEGVGGAAAS